MQGIGHDSNAFDVLWVSLWTSGGKGGVFDDGPIRGESIDVCSLSECNTGGPSCDAFSQGIFLPFGGSCVGYAFAEGASGNSGLDSGVVIFFGGGGFLGPVFAGVLDAGGIIGC